MKKGQKMPEELKEKHSIVMKGKVAWNKGLTQEDPRIAKYVKKRLDNGSYKWSEERKLKYSQNKKGIVPLCTFNRRSYKGEGNPFYNKSHKEETIQKLKLYEKTDEQKKKLSISRIGQHNSPSTEFKKGELSPNWKDGSSLEIYGDGFDKKLKEQIRKRDGYRCQECFREQSELRTKNNMPRKLSIHHIDFNKKNNNPSNLISLCLNCHSQTQFDRDSWSNYFGKEMALRGLK